ncbi:ankyrin [Zopfia rhizophila CBS 207.26]|uniref:Ankyrin n=1 Tax=Zopfia rhizophila CBS 207.26 TaxID=1314779 RepID=A0A6A6DF42_9PEZI|nr:ankyrin [Zopfia rhizophila CBS 207.26]
MLQELFGSRTVFYSSPELHRILQSLLAACHKCVIIVDGLHEMTEKDIFALLGIFRQLSSQRSLTKRIRFGIFCREQAGRNVNIETALPNVIHLNLTLDLLEKDIAYFIDESIRQKTMYERQLTDNEAVLEDVRSILKENGERMFLWIDLQLRTIWDTCFNDEAIRLALSGLPLGIEDTYSRCLSRMSQDDITRQYGHRILYLTAHVQRPLSQVELREAISVQEMFDYWDDLKTIRGQLLQYCANLVEQDHLTAVIRFVHPSVKTFLETHFHPTRYQSASILTGKAYTDANNFVTIGMEYCRDVCFKYLTMHDFGMQVAVRHTVQTNFATAEVLDKIMQGGNRMTRWTGRQFLKMRNPQARSHMTLDRPKRLANNLQENATVTQGYRLLAYVQEYWPSHARSLQPTDPAWPTFVGIAAAMHSPYRLHPWMQPGMSPIQFQRGLFCYAIQNNNMPLLWALVKECNKKRVAPLTELIIDEGESRACHLAASKGLDDMLKWLIQVGGPKQLTIKDARGDTALHASASSGNVKILELILEHLSAKDLLTDRNNRGDVPLVLAAMNGQSQYITKAVQAVKNLRSSKQRTQVLQDVLASILRYHPNAMDRLSALELCIETIVAALLDVHRDVSWMELVGLALDDDVLLFFDLFLDHPNSRAIIKGSLKNEPPDAPSGTSILGRACTISRSTKPERARIVELLLEHLPDEVTWQTVIENENAEKVNIITPVSLALSRVAVSEVAVEVVSILSNQLLKLSQQRKYVPQMIQEIGRPSDGDLDHLELLQRIHPSSVENFLISGALKLQQHFVDMPKTNLLHVAVMQESSALLQAIYNYGAQQNNANILYSLTAPSDTDETALMMAINGGKELHTHYTLAIAAQCLKFDDVFFAQRYKDGQVFRGQLTKLLVELFNGIPRVLENARSRDWKNSMDTVGLAESLHGRVTSAENYIQSWGYPRFKLSVELQLRALPRTEEQPESQTPQQSDSQEPQHPGSQTLQHAGNPQQQTVQGRQHS